jgi:membrane protein YdbS with pleckstrin-like domain
MDPEEGKLFHQSQAFLWIRVTLVQVLIILLWGLSTIVSELLGASVSWIFIVFLALILLDAILVIYVFLSWVSMTYIIQPDLITIRRGILGVQEHIYKTYYITAVHVVQSPLGRAFNYGTIEFEYRGKPVSLINIDSPHAYEHLIKQGASYETTSRR